MRQVYTEFFKTSLSRLLRQGNRISIDFGLGHMDISVSRLQELKRVCDEVSDLITAVLAQRCTVEEREGMTIAAIGDRTRQFKKPAPARHWVVRALCGRR